MALDFSLLAFSLIIHMLIRLYKKENKLQHVKKRKKIKCIRIDGQKRRKRKITT
jgi:hypothetical protein